jgi:4-carboxymuconolactone decarboxylase
MNNQKSTFAALQGFGSNAAERLPLPPINEMNEKQRAAADAIIAGPRKAIFGPFVPLIHAPEIMASIGSLGEVLRFRGALSDRIRELVICFVSRETSNQFEWQTHAPLAIKAGTSQATIDALSTGTRPRQLPADEEIVLDFVAELLKNNGVSDQTYAEVESRVGKQGVVELTTLVGYFVMVCWVMNVAHTAGPASSAAPALTGFPQ